VTDCSPPESERFDSKNGSRCFYCGDSALTDDPLLPASIDGELFLTHRSCLDREWRAHLDFRKDITIELYNEAGQLVIAYIVYRCWVSEFQALPDLDGDAGTLAFQSITLENEGWERDTSVQEPAEPTFKG
jgi:hypothetical protein